MFKTLLRAGALALAMMVCTPAFADAVLSPNSVVTGATVAPSTSIALLPWYVIAEPYLLTAFGVVFAALFGWLVQQFQVRTGIQVSQQARANVQQAAMNAAGRFIASQEGNVANLKVDVHSPMIAAEVAKVQAAVPDDLAKLNVTPERLGNLIQGKIGILQSGGAAAAATPLTDIPLVIPGGR